MGSKEGKDGEMSRRGEKRRSEGTGELKGKKKETKFYRAPATSTGSPPATKPLWVNLSLVVAWYGGFAADSGRFCCLLDQPAAAAVFSFWWFLSFYPCWPFFVSASLRLNIMPEAWIENVPPPRSQSVFLLHVWQYLTLSAYTSYTKCACNR